MFVVALTRLLFSALTVTDSVVGGVHSAESHFSSDGVVVQVAVQVESEQLVLADRLQYALTNSLSRCSLFKNQEHCL